MSAGATFALDVRKWCEKAKADADMVVGKVVHDIAAQLDLNSPVGDAKYWKNPAPKGYVGGHFRGNWQMEIGSIPRGELPGVDPSGQRTLGAIIAKIPAQAAGKYYWFANNVPYAVALEYGHSRQAPAPGGVVGVTVAMFQQIVRRAVEGIK